MTPAVLNKLRKKLPTNAAVEIHKIVGYKISYINMVIAGTRNNQTIIDCAIEVAAKYQAELKQKTETINSL